MKVKTSLPNRVKRHIISDIFDLTQLHKLRFNNVASLANYMKYCIIFT